jgi:hypothetical protein
LAAPVVARTPVRAAISVEGVLRHCCRVDGQRYEHRGDSICGRRGGPLYLTSTILIHAAASSPSLFIMRARGALAVAKPALKPSPGSPEQRLATDLLQGLCANLPNVENCYALPPPEPGLRPIASV